MHVHRLFLCLSCGVHGIPQHPKVFHETANVQNNVRDTSMGLLEGAIGVPAGAPKKQQQQQQQQQQRQQQQQ